jgi:hypothetical protein
MEEQRFFAILDKDNKVVNAHVFPKNPEPITTLENPEPITTLKPEDLLDSYPEDHNLQEYSEDVSITNNLGSIGYTYDLSLNAFIPPKPEETYILNTETYTWEPDVNMEYDLHKDGIMYKWNGSGWILANN